MVGVACFEPVGLGIDSTRKGNAMKRDSISVELVASGLEVTWENIAVSPERFCSDGLHLDAVGDDGTGRDQPVPLSPRPERWST